MKHLKVIKDPEAFKLLGDETRRKMVFLLRVKEMTVSQIAGELNITPQAVYHHIKKLQEADMAEVTREERVGHLIESYYRATAEAFMCSVGTTSQEFGEVQLKTILNALQRIGFNLKFNDHNISHLVEIQRNLKHCCSSDIYSDAITKLDDVDFITKQIVQEYAEMLSMSDDEFTKQQEHNKKFRDLLKSLAQ
jgi:DNA-binding transcriptional ArsR family regulator